jgi:hypothetical protein
MYWLAPSTGDGSSIAIPAQQSVRVGRSFAKNEPFKKGNPMEKKQKLQPWLHDGAEAQPYEF